MICTTICIVYVPGLFSHPAFDSAYPCHVRTRYVYGIDFPGYCVCGTVEKTRSDKKTKKQKKKTPHLPPWPDLSTAILIIIIKGRLCYSACIWFLSSVSCAVPQLSPPPPPPPPPHHYPNTPPPKSMACARRHWTLQPHTGEKKSCITIGNKHSTLPSSGVIAPVTTTQAVSVTLYIPPNPRRNYNTVPVFVIVVHTV